MLTSHIMRGRLAVALLAIVFVVCSADVFAQGRRGHFGFGGPRGHFGFGHRGFGFNPFFAPRGFHGFVPHRFGPGFGFGHSGFGFHPFFGPRTFGGAFFHFGHPGGFGFRLGSGIPWLGPVFPGFAPFGHPFYQPHFGFYRPRGPFPFFFHRPRYLPAGFITVWVRPAWVSTEQGEMHFPGGWAVSESDQQTSAKPAWVPARWEKTENGSVYVPGQWAVEWTEGENPEQRQ